MTLYLSGLNEKIRNSLKDAKFYTLEELMVRARLAEHPIEQGSMTVQQYKDFFVNHDVYNKYDSNTLISMFLSGLKKDIREAVEGKHFSSMEELFESALLAEDPIEQRSSTVDEYVDFFINHPVFKTHNQTTLMMMFRDGLKEEIRDELGETKFSTLEDLIESAQEAEQILLTSSEESEEAVTEMDPELRDILGFSDEKEDMYDSDPYMDESEDPSVEEDLTDDTISSGEFRVTDYNDEDSAEEDENDSQTGSESD